MTQKTHDVEQRSSLGPVWILNMEERQHARIPDEFRLSPADIAELRALGFENIVGCQESWARLHGIARFYKKDGVWHDRYPVSPLRRG